MTEGTEQPAMLSNHEAIIDTLIKVFTLIGMLWAAIKLLGPLIMRIHKVLDRLELTTDAVLGTSEQPGLKDQFAKMQREVMPNGGSSVSDRVSQVLGEMRVRLDFDSSIAHFSMDKFGNLTWANRTFLRWLGAQPPDVMDNRWLGMVHPEDREDAAEDVHRAVKDGRFTRFSARFQDGNGGWLWLYTEMTPLRGSSDCLIGYSGFARIDVERSP